MLSPFGIAVRKLRLDKGMRLLDLARRIGRSAAFASAIETGRKPIPDAYVVMVARAMELTASEIRELRSAADQTKKEVVVEELPEDQRELVAAVARKIDELPSDMMAKLKKIVLKSSEEENPFRRKRRGIFVPAMSTETIRGFADKVRSTFVEDILNKAIVSIQHCADTRSGTHSASSPTKLRTTYFRKRAARRTAEGRSSLSKSLLCAWVITGWSSKTRNLTELRGKELANGLCTGGCRKMERRDLVH
jgi:transcriptional regulator with XRE-family HTH domain